MACKHLAIHGSGDAVPELAKLLPDPQLSSWARIALEAIPGRRPGEALREAAESLEGRLLVGTINSIGVRRDAIAVNLLETLLKEEDAEVASAAAVALGNIANDAAARALRESLFTAPSSVRSAFAEGCVLCAERLDAAGRSDVAAEIYDQVRTADVPTQRIVEATRGAILARKQAGLPLLMETFQSPNNELFQLALSTAREFPGVEVDQALAAEMVSAAPDRATLIIQAMADRPKSVVLAAVLDSARHGNKRVRLSAIEALRRVGNESCLPALLEIAVDDDADLSQAAEETLAALPGASVDQQIVAMLPKAEGQNLQLLLKLIGQRRIDAINGVYAALDYSDPAVRHAALTALGETVKLNSLHRLISEVVNHRHPDDATVAQQALGVASARMPDRAACVLQLATAMERASEATKPILLEIIGGVGGTKALEVIGDAAMSDDPQMQDTGSRLLGKWNSVDAAPALLELAKTAPKEKYQIRALRGYIGLARKFAMSNVERAKMCRLALEVSTRLEEKKLALDVIKLYPSHATLKLAVSAQQDPELTDLATIAAQEIERKLTADGSDVSGVLSRPQ